MDVDSVPEPSAENTAGPSGLRRGLGRIVRDADGNVVDIQLPEDEDAPENRLVEDDIPDPSKVDSLAPWVNLGRSIDPRDGSVASNTHVVQSESDIDVNQSLCVLVLMNTGLFARDCALARS